MDINKTIIDYDTYIDSKPQEIKGKGYAKKLFLSPAQLRRLENARGKASGSCLKIV